MAEHPSWMQRIPNWWPVGVGVVLLILALGETRWEIQRHTGQEAIQDAKDEELQWKGMADLNKEVTMLRAWVTHYEQRLSDSTFQDWVAWRSEMELSVENHDARIDRLEDSSR